MASFGEVFSGRIPAGVAAALAGLVGASCALPGDDEGMPEPPPEGIGPSAPGTPAEVPGVVWTPLVELPDCLVRRAENPVRVAPLVFADCVGDDPDDGVHDCRELLPPTTGQRRFLPVDAPPEPFGSAEEPFFFVPGARLPQASVVAVGDAARERLVAAYRGCVETRWVVRDGRLVGYHQGTFLVVGRDGTTVDVYERGHRDAAIPNVDVSDQGIAWFDDEALVFQPTGEAPEIRATFGFDSRPGPFDLRGDTVVAARQIDSGVSARAWMLRLVPPGGFETLTVGSGTSIGWLRLVGDGDRVLFGDPFDAGAMELMVPERAGGPPAARCGVEDEVRAPSDTETWLRDELLVLFGTDRTGARPVWLELRDLSCADGDAARLRPVRPPPTPSGYEVASPILVDDERSVLLARRAGEGTVIAVDHRRWPVLEDRQLP